MLNRICSVVRREETSPNGEGSMRRYFCGEEAAAAKEEAAAAAWAAAAGEAAAEAGADKGAHRRRLGDAGLSSGSKSRVLFSVAPHAMAWRRRGRGLGRGGEERARAPEPAAGRCGRRRPARAAAAGGAHAGSVRRGRLLPPRPRLGWLPREKRRPGRSRPSVRPSDRSPAPPRASRSHARACNSVGGCWDAAAPQTSQVTREDVRSRRAQIEAEEEPRGCD